MNQLYFNLPSSASESQLSGIPYVIREGGLGRGLFSLLSGTVCHLNIAEKYGLVPIVDMCNNITEYYEKTAELGTNNVWNYYFKPVSPIGLTDLDLLPLVAYSAQGYPAGYPYSVTQDPDLIRTFQRYVSVNGDIIQEVNEWANSCLPVNVLGVHWRAQEMRTAAAHWFPPTQRQIFAAIDYCLEQADVNSIFAVSEDATCIHILRSRYGSRLLVRDHFRTCSPVNSYRIYPRHLHKYLLGKECLIDVLILSKCSILISCTSNMAEGAKLFRESQPLFDIVVNNGPNLSRGLGRKLRLHRYMWSIKNFTPASFGGFSLSAIERHDGLHVSRPFS